MNSHTLDQPTTHATLRIALNYKGLPYRTEWVEYPDLAPLLSSYNVAPNPPPSVPYTVPTIYDPHTHRFIADSTKIALYLDATYPSTPPILPPPIRVFDAAFQHALITVHERIVPLIMYPAMTRLNPRSQAYFRETREKRFGCKMEEICPLEKQAEQWARLEKAFSLLASWFEAAGDGRLLLMGTDEGKICHADTQIAGRLKWIQTVFGKGSEEWKRVEGFDGGRWKRFLAIMEKWADVIQ